MKLLPALVARMLLWVPRCRDLWRIPNRQTHLAKGNHMLWTIAVILLALWVLGLATSYTLGGFLHILLVLAVVTVLVRIIQGRRAIT
jgi:hypothetical protein